MKLLMVTGLGSAKDLASGKRGAFYNTLEEFHKYWERIDIIAPKIKGVNSGVMELFGNVYVHISPWPIVFHPLWFLKKGLAIYREQKFDLMTVHEFPPFYNGIGARLLWSRLSKEKSRILDSRSESGQKNEVPYVIEIHHVVGYPKAANTKEEIYRSLMRVFIEWDSKKAKAVRVVNQGQVPKFLIEAGVPKEKIIYAPSLYIDLDIFKPMNLPKEYDLIFVGRLEDNKGINLFLETVKFLNDPNSKFYIPNSKSLIVGDGSLFDKIKIEIQNSKLNILLHGWAKNHQEIAELMNKSRVLVMPSYNEGGPRVVVEAMACGVPVLATPVGIVQDVVERTGAGVIIDWDAQDIASKAENMLNDEEGYIKYGQAGIQTAKKYDKKETIKNYAIRLQQLF